MGPASGPRSYRISTSATAPRQLGGLGWGARSGPPIKLNVPARDDRPAIGAVHLGDDPRIDLALLVVGRRRHPELREEAGARGVVELQQGLVGNGRSVALDGLERRPAHVADA